MERPHQSGTATTPDGDVLFCAFCRVSVSQREVARGVAIRTPAGRTFCGFCVTATPDERERRRQELENEFADDAPVPSPAPVVVSRAAEPRPAPSLSAADELLLARVG
jgi:hypothetical protein